MTLRSIVRSDLRLAGRAGALDCVTLEPSNASPKADLLFVHGAWSSSWYWETFFLPWFAERGYRCRAVSLRGHGRSEGRVRWASIGAYVEDVAMAGRDLSDPVVIGHSMGGFVAQKYAAKYPVRGLALLASVPPWGVWYALMRILQERPLAFLRTLATLDLYGVVADPDTARGLLFSRDESRTDKDHLLKHLKSESFRALIDMLFSPVRKRSMRDVPITVIGAEFDQIISHGNVNATARFHRVPPIMLPLASHMLTVDDRWQDAAILVENWLRRDVLGEDLATPKPVAKAVADVTTNTDGRYPPHFKKRAKMLGQMQYHPLVLSSLLTHAEANHPTTKIWSREAPEEMGEVGGLHVQSWGETGQRARRLASALSELGVSEGDRVASIAWNTHRHLELYYGVTGIGAVLHTINPRLSLEHLSYMINQAADQVVFFDGTFAGLVQTLKPLCPTVRHWVQLSQAPQKPRWTDQRYESLIEAAAPIVDWPELDEHGAAALCYTSGTTGMPKGVLYSHRSLVLESMTAIGPDALALTRDDVVAPIVPMFHVNAWSIPFAAAISGSSLALPGSNLGGDALYELFEQTGTTVSAGVPTIWQALLDHARKTGKGFSTMTRTIVGGSAASEHMIRAFRETHGVEVIHGWGMTETAPLGAINALTAKEAKGLSADAATQLLKRQGRAPFGVQLRVENGGAEAQPRDGTSAGHLKIRGHWVIDRYFGQEEPATKDDWFDTGDIATLDADAVMTITDRDKDLIKSGGEWISSVQLEETAVTHPDVVEAAAIAVPHPKWDERPLVVCVSDATTDPQTADVKALFAKRLPSWQVPDIVFTDQLPLGATGKVLKADLRARYAEYYSNAN
jgi:fatty-acyl-CoA synthase